jgi:hypothetical protein
MHKHIFCFTALLGCNHHVHTVSKRLQASQHAVTDSGLILQSLQPATAVRSSPTQTLGGLPSCQVTALTNRPSRTVLLRPAFPHTTGNTTQYCYPQRQPKSLHKTVQIPFYKTSSSAHHPSLAFMPKQFTTSKQTLPQLVAYTACAIQGQTDTHHVHMILHQYHRFNILI